MDITEKQLTAILNLESYLRSGDKLDHSSITKEEEKEWGALNAISASHKIKELISEVREHDEEVSGLVAAATGDPEWYKNN